MFAFITSSSGGEELELTFIGRHQTGDDFFFRDKFGGQNKEHQQQEDQINHRRHIAFDFIIVIFCGRAGMMLSCNLTGWLINACLGQTSHQP